MKVSYVLDSVEQTCALHNTGKTLAPDRAILLDWLNDGIAEIVSEQEWDWAMRFIYPVIMLKQSERYYQLPNDFGDNFVQYGDHDGTKFLCKLRNTTNSTESFLNYESPSKFFSRNMASTTGGTSNYYTIVTKPGGSRLLVCDPPPDSTTGAFGISGLYVPTEWVLNYEDELPPMPSNCSVLKYYVLERIFTTPGFKDVQLAQFYGGKMVYHKGILIKRAQKQRRGQLVLGSLVQHNYSQMEYSGPGI